MLKTSETHGVRVCNTSLSEVFFRKEQVGNENRHIFNTGMVALVLSVIVNMCMMRYSLCLLTVSSVLFCKCACTLIGSYFLRVTLPVELA